MAAATWTSSQQGLTGLLSQARPCMVSVSPSAQEEGIWVRRSLLPAGPATPALSIEAGDPSPTSSLPSMLCHKAFRSDICQMEVAKICPSSCLFKASEPSSCVSPTLPVFYP
jgi:hypothetical protein